MLSTIKYISKSQMALTHRQMHFIQRANSYVASLDMVKQSTLNPSQNLLYHQLKNLENDLLDINKLIAHTDKWKWLFKQYPSRKELLTYLGKDYMSKKRTYFYKGILRHCKELSANVRKQDFLHQHAVEISEAHENGWYIIFNTLTASDRHMNTAFKLGSSIIRDYIRNFNRHIATQCYGSIRKAPPTNEWSRYSCVTERGAKSGRLHYHVLHFVKHLPFSWQKDPNHIASGPPINREILAIKKLQFWKYGLQQPIAVRYSTNDSYGKLGWKYPYELTDDGIQPILQKSPLAVAGYMAKYLAKLSSYNQHYGDADKWRIKKSRNFGSQMMNRLLQNPQYQTEAITGLLKMKLEVILNGTMPLPSAKQMKLLSLKKQLCTMPLSTLCDTYLNVTEQRQLFNPPANLSMGKHFKKHRISHISRYQRDKDFNHLKKICEQRSQELGAILITELSTYYNNKNLDIDMRNIVNYYKKIATRIELRGHYERK